jgi:putative FmdB family regulatory protein
LRRLWNQNKGNSARRSTRPPDITPTVTIIMYHESQDWKMTMPTYDYVCDACNHRFEEIQSFSAEPLKVCPSCGADQLRRLFGTGAAILFKGSGFYETDYRSDSYKTAAKTETDAAKPAEKTAAEKPVASGDTAKGASAKTDGSGK